MCHYTCYIIYIISQLKMDKTEEKHPSPLRYDHPNPNANGDSLPGMNVSLQHTETDAAGLMIPQLLLAKNKYIQ